MSRPGESEPIRPPAIESVRASVAIEPILASLSEEIRKPLELLRSGIDRLIDDPSRPITDSERTQAQTMLVLCEDLDRLTRECLEAAPSTDA